MLRLIGPAHGVLGGYALKSRDSMMSQGRGLMGRLTVLAVGVVAVIAAGCGQTGHGVSTSHPSGFWHRQHPSREPAAEMEASTADDPLNQGVILFGGLSVHAEGASPVGALGDTWTWNGSDWVERHPATSPPARYGETMAYDQATRTVVLFGGLGCGHFCGDTWTWNGSDWVERHPATSPPARWHATMAYDAATRQVVLFGGGGCGALPCGDTWTWNGSDWASAASHNSPSGQIFASMAFDPGSRRVVLYGGTRDLVEPTHDTWTWNGASWRMAHPIPSPASRQSPALAKDSTSNDLVLVSGSLLGLGTAFRTGGTWTYGTS